jgi:phosphonate transport system substrate-binding protein
MYQFSYHRACIILFLVLNLILSGCKEKAIPTPTPSPTPTPTPAIDLQLTPTETVTPEPSPTATLEPLGSPGNPVVIGFISNSPSSTFDDNIAQLTQILTNATGFTFTSKTFTNYGDLLTAFSEGNVHVALLPPVTYLVARQRGLADVLQVTNHFGRYAYGTQFLAHVASGFTPYFDATTGQNTTDAGSALAQFSGKRPCFTESTSVSGYLLPLGILTSLNIPTQPAVMTQNQEAVVRALYIRQVCDFGTTFALSGDPRTASGIQQSLPDVLSKVIVIWRSEAVIPSFNISVSASMPQPIRQALNDALISLVRTPDGKTMLTASAGYDIQDLKPIGDNFYDPLRSYLKAAGIDIENFVGE